MTGYDDQGRPVLAVGFEFPDDEPQPTTRAVSSTELDGAIEGALLIVVTGRRAGIATRAGALCHLLGVRGFGSQSESARRVHVQPAALSRAVKALRRELRKLSEVGFAAAHIERARTRLKNTEQPHA